MYLHLTGQIATVSTIRANDIFKQWYNLPGLPRKRYYGVSLYLTL